MRSLTNLSIKSKLIIMLLAVSSCSILVTAYISYQSGKSNLTNRVFKQLTSVRASKAYQIESYIQTLRNHVQTLGKSPFVGDALKEFNTGYETIAAKQKNVDKLESKLKAYYRNEFISRLSKSDSSIQATESILRFFLPSAPASKYLQYQYIAANPYPVGKKHLLDDPKDGSTYSKIHARYHPIFRNIIEKFGYYDLFLVNTEGRIVYTVYKETDYSTSLTTDAYNETNLARLITQVRQEKQRDYAQIIDFESYSPSYGAPAAFIAVPIFDQTKFIGAIAVQIPVNEINNVMTGNQNWESDGLGKSGETYLVGQDYLMRSVSRFLIEDPEQYFQILRSLDVSEKTLKRIKQFQTSILEQKVATIGVKEAIAGKKDTQIINDYRNIPVLSSYAPLRIEQLDWVILAEIDLAEAYAPIRDFEQQLLISATILMLLVTLLAMGLAYLFVKPINQLIENAQKVEKGKLNAVVPLNSEDEFGELAKSFNAMVSSLRAQTELVELKNQENERLFLSVFPLAIAKRLQRGEKNIAERVSNVAVLFAELTGFTKLSASLSAYEVVSILNDIVGAFDEAAEKYGIEKIKTVGDRYMAVCGLSLPYLDHDKRAIDFAIEVLAIVRKFSHDRRFQLNIRIGIHSGNVIAGIVGKTKHIYDVWGDTVDQSQSIITLCPIDGIIVSAEVYHRLKDIYEFDLLEFSGTKNWVLANPSHDTRRI